MLANATIREAKQGDKETILEFCKNTFEWGDYIEDVWDYWFRDSEGRIFIAEVGSQPVGICHFRLLKPGEAWLEGARVHPDFRRKGIGTLLHAKAAEYARKQGAKITRLATSTANIPSQRQIEKLGYTLEGVWSMFQDEEVKELPDSSFNEKTTWPASSSSSNVWRYIRSSPVFKAGGGLCNRWWAWHSLERKDLSRLPDLKCAVAHERNSIRGVALFTRSGRVYTPPTKGDKEMLTVYLDGNSKSLPQLIGFLRSFSRENRVERIHFSAPRHKVVEEACVRVGLEVESTMVVYARREAT